MRMEVFGFLLPLCVFICFSDCLPVNNTKLDSRREIKTNVKFPNSSTPTVRTPSGVWARDRNTKNSTSRISAGEEMFVFPDDDPPQQQKLAVRFKPISNSKRSPACENEGLTYCEDIDEYPGNYLENVFQNVVDDYQELLGTDEIKSAIITQRFDGNPSSESPLCPSTEQVVFPKTAKTKDDKWLFIVNHGAYVQGVRIEKCLKSGEHECFFTDSFPNGYKTSCKQKYIYRKLVAISEDGKPITDTFQLPSCCSCSVISSGLASRFGVSRQGLNSTSSTTSKPAI